MGFTWTLQVEGGMGDPQNGEIVSLATYAGKLYAGTQQNEASGAELWAYDGIAWTRVLTGGFDQSALPSDPKNIAASALATFGDKLYIGTRYDYGGAEIWAFDGVTATQVVSNGLANESNVAVSVAGVFCRQPLRRHTERQRRRPVAQQQRLAVDARRDQRLQRARAMLPSLPWP